MNILKRFLILIPLLVFFAIFVCLWKGLHMDPSKIPSPLINKPAPDFSLTLLDSDKKITKNDLLGRVTILNVWATWCYSCAVEHDFLLQISKENKSSKNKFIFIGLDYKDDDAAALKWLKAQGNPYSIVAVDKNGQAAIDWGVYGSPETFVIDKRGIVRYKQIGPVDQTVWNTIQPIVTTLENEA